MKTAAACLHLGLSFMHRTLRGAAGGAWLSIGGSGRFNIPVEDPLRDIAATGRTKTLLYYEF